MAPYPWWVSQARYLENPEINSKQQGMGRGSGQGGQEKKREVAPKETFLLKKDRHKRVLIVCEGEKTEPDYFRQFRVTSAEIKIVGTGYNTMALVREALRLKKEAWDNDEPYDQVWCVFDRDSFPAPDVDNAWHTARKKKLRTALSNEAFELWFLLHFDYMIAAHTRYQYTVVISRQ